MLSWHFVNLETYKAASEAEKSADKLFFISDTGEIYRGTQSFSESVILFTEEPAVKATGKLYVNSTTLEGKIWNGTAWQTVIQPVQASLNATNTNQPVSGKAVSDFVAGEINKITNGSQLVKDVEYVAASNSLKVTMADGTNDSVPMTNIAADLVYDKATGLLQVKNAAGTAIGTGINLDLERFIEEASYDHETRTITLRFNTGAAPLTIDVGDLVDTYTAADSSSVHLAVTGNEFTAEVLLSADAGNQLVKKANGLYVAAVDMSGKVDKVTDAAAGNIATFAAGGNVADSGAKVGGATLATTPLTTTLATEKAVDAVRTALTTLINGKIAKMGTGAADQVVTSTADGSVQRSNYTVGGETLTGAANVLATEKAVDAFVKSTAVAKSNIRVDGALKQDTASASDEFVPSEKAMVSALSWITTV